MKISDLSSNQLKELVRMRTLREYYGITITRMKLDHSDELSVSYIVYSKEWAPARVGVGFDSKFWPQEVMYLQLCGVTDFNV